MTKAEIDARTDDICIFCRKEKKEVFVLKTDQFPSAVVCAKHLHSLLSAQNGKPEKDKA